MGRGRIENVLNASILDEKEKSLISALMNLSVRDVNELMKLL